MGGLLLSDSKNVVEPFEALQDDSLDSFGKQCRGSLYLGNKTSIIRHREIVRSGEKD